MGVAPPRDGDELPEGFRDSEEMSAVFTSLALSSFRLTFIVHVSARTRALRCLKFPSHTPSPLSGRSSSRFHFCHEIFWYVFFFLDNFDP